MKFVIHLLFTNNSKTILISHIVYIFPGQVISDQLRDLSEQLSRMRGHYGDSLAAATNMQAAFNQFQQTVDVSVVWAGCRGLKCPLDAIL